MKFKDLGFAFAKGLARTEYSTSIEIVTPCYADEHGFTPAQSVNIHGKVNIEALKELCEEVLREYEEIKKTAQF